MVRGRKQELVSRSPKGTVDEQGQRQQRHKRSKDVGLDDDEKAWHDLISRRQVAAG